MGNNGFVKEDDEIEIDLWQLLMELKKRVWIILAVTVGMGGLAGAYSRFVLTPQYSSTAMMYILSKDTTLTSLADLQIGSQLTQDYKIIVTSRPVLDEVNEKLVLGLDYESLKRKITIDNPADTRILSITVLDPDPYRAKAIADCVAETSSEYIGEIMEMIPPKILENGVVAEYKTSPSNPRNAMLGAIAGMAAVCGVIVLRTLMNDTDQTEADVERYLGLTVLASVPLREGEAKEKRDKSAGSRIRGSRRGKGQAETRRENR